MYTNDKITNGGKIISAQTYKMQDTPFYIFLYPKADNPPTLTTLNVKLNYNKDIQPYPFIVGAWNPVVVDSLVVDDTLLSSFDIYWGTE